MRERVSWDKRDGEQSATVPQHDEPGGLTLAAFRVCIALALALRERNAFRALRSNVKTACVA
jgi:hypothetical protein